MCRKKVFVSGCYDMLHSGHVAFFKSAAAFGDLYVGIGSDATVEELKNSKPVYSETERLYMVKAVRYVTDAFINRGSGMLDFIETVDMVKPDVFVVNSDGGSDEKRRFCRERGIEYVELTRTPEAGLDARSTTSLRRDVRCQIPYRVDIAGTWIDQPFVSTKGAGWEITVSIEPTHDFADNSGMATSTRNAARMVWPYQLPPYDEEMTAKLLFSFKNNPEHNSYVSGAQDAIGICMSGLTRHYYDNCYWPKRIESCHDERVLSWLESHLCLVPTVPRSDNLNVLEGMGVTPEKVRALTDASAACWDAIIATNLDGFARAFADSFAAQVAMFPAMVQPGVQERIDEWKRRGALAWKMCGAGGGGYMALVVDTVPADAIPIKIRRE